MYGVATIGAGIIGRSLVYGLRKYQAKAVLIEKRNDVSVGTIKTNSVITHGGHDPLPDSKMAKYNVAGNTYIKKLYGELDTLRKQIGTLIMAFSEADKETLGELKDRGVQNGVKDMEIWDKECSHRGEPHVSQEAGAALYSPNTGIVNPWELALALAEVTIENGVEVKLNTEVKNIEKTDAGHSVETNQGVIDAAYVCNAAGMFADEVNEVVNDATFKIEPNRGGYYPLDKSQGNLVSHVILQRPNENGEGVLAAPTVYDNLIAGPDSQPISGEDVPTTTEGLDYVRNTALKSIPDISFHEPIHNFAGVHARTKEDDLFIYEDPENCLFCNIAGVASPGLSSVPVTVPDIIEMMRGSGLPLTKKEACMNMRSVVRFREMNHEECTALIKEHPEYGKIICRYEAVTGGEIIDATYRPVPAVSVDAVKRRRSTGMGCCQSGFCSPRAQEIIIRELKKNLKGVPLDREGMILITGETKAAGDEQG